MEGVSTCDKERHRRGYTTQKVGTSVGTHGAVALTVAFRLAANALTAARAENGAREQEQKSLVTYGAALI